MRDTQWQAQSQGDRSPYHLVVKPQAARRDRQGEKPIAAIIIILTAILNSQRMKKLRYAIQKSTKIKLE